MSFIMNSMSHITPLGAATPAHVRANNIILPITCSDCSWIPSAETNFIANYATSTIGSRSSSYVWMGSCSNPSNTEAYFFGGIGYQQDTTKGYISDVWKYNTLTKTWTFVKGSQNVSSPGVYTTHRPTSLPGPREGAAYWTANDGAMWMFGGYGMTNSPSEGFLSDLWNWNGNHWGWVRFGWTRTCCSCMFINKLSFYRPVAHLL